MEILGPASLALEASFSVNISWISNDLYPRLLSDVNGDGKADIVGFASSGVYVSLGQSDRTFAPAILALDGFFSVSSSWVSFNQYPRQLGDVNGDGRGDIVGFGGSEVFISFGQEDGTFSIPQTAFAGPFTSVSGWINFSEYPRLLGDVNGDGRDDIVGFGSDNVYVSLSQEDGTFSSAIEALSGIFTVNSSWINNDRTPRQLGDVNGDGRADVVGFGEDKVYVSFGQEDGTFSSPIEALDGFFTFNSTWTSFDLYPRQVGDVDGDGRDDIIGFTTGKVYAALAKEDGTFDTPFEVVDAWFPGDTTWTSFDLYPRYLADVDGDGKDDIVGFSANDVYVSDPNAPVVVNNNGGINQPTNNNGGVNQTPDNPTPDNQNPDNNGGVNQTPDNQTPDNQTPDNNGGVNQTPDNQTPDNQTPDNNGGVNQTPDNQTPDNQTPDNNGGVNQTPDNQTPDNQTPDNNGGVNQTPDNQTPDNNGGVNQTPDNPTPDNNGGVNQTPDNQTPDNNGGVNQTPDNPTPNNNGGVNQTPDNQTPDNQTPDNNGDNNRIFVDRNEMVSGTNGDDIFDATNSKGGNCIHGKDGDDTFFLGSGDLASGGKGNDKFFVQTGGDNLISGGEGADQFWIVTNGIPESANIITDFNQCDGDVIGFQNSNVLGISAHTVHLNEICGDTYIDFNGHTLAVLKNVTGLHIDSDYFTFT